MAVIQLNRKELPNDFSARIITKIQCKFESQNLKEHNQTTKQQHIISSFKLRKIKKQYVKYPKLDH